jgi:hypothetical protein
VVVNCVGMADDDLDDILSSALDDLEEDNNDDSGNQNADLGNAVKAAAEASAKSAQEGGEAAAAGAAGGAGDPFGMGFDLSDMQEVLKELQDGDLGKVLEAALKMGDGEEDGDENPLLAAMRAAGGEGGAGADVAGMCLSRSFKSLKFRGDVCLPMSWELNTRKFGLLNAIVWQILVICDIAID